jgi:flagellar hook-basal body complex protein FliE
MSDLGIRPDAAQPGAARAAGKGAKGNAGSFGKVLGEAVARTEALQDKAQAMTKSLATGETKSLHEVMISMTEAELSFKMMMEVRNRLLEAYQEVMRMQV